jgi:hypothetical protein
MKIVAAYSAATIHPDRKNHMIYAFIRGYIGGFGRMLLDFYEANNFVINAIVLAYGACVYLAHISYLKAYRCLLETLGLKLESGAKSNYSRRKLDFENLDWSKMRRTYFFPLISEPQSFLVNIKSNPVLRRLFNEEKVRSLLKAADANKK